MKEQLFSFLKTQWTFARWIGLFGAYVPVSTAEIGYKADYLTDTIYSFDLQNGISRPILSIPGGVDLIDLQAYGSDTLYALGFNDRNLYAVDLKDNSYRRVTPIPIGDSMESVYSIGIASPSTAYVVGFEENKIYSVNLESGASSTLLSFSGAPGLTNIAMRDSLTAYVVGYNDNNLYEIDLADNSYRLVTPVPIGSPGRPSLEGIALADENTAYVLGNMDGNVYSVNLLTGDFSLVTSVPIGEGINPINFAIGEGIGYTVNNLGGEIYAVDLSSGNVNVLANIMGTNLTGVTLPGAPLCLQIPVKNLDGNNLNLANYLNKNTSEDVVSLFARLKGGLAPALESAAPTRNAYLTYASQMGSLALSRLIHDHERQKRFQHHTRQDTNEVSYSASQGELLANAGDQISSKKARCRPENPYTIWIAPFGGYSQVQAHHQSPPFSMGFGGITAAWDYNGINQNFLGVGATYLRTQLQDEHGTGHGHINQGLVTLYGTLNARSWYFDLGASGGGYSGEIVRKISFRGVSETAKSDPQGWQFAPSFEVGYTIFDSDRCGSSWFGVAPFLLVDWVANWEKELRESGAKDLNMGQKSRFCSLLHGETGLRLNETVRWNGGKAVFREKVAYSYQKAFGTGSLEAFLLGFPGSFTVETLSGAQNLGVAELSILILADRSSMPYVDIWYEGEFGEGFQLHQAVLEIGKNF